MLFRSERSDLSNLVWLGLPAVLLQVDELDHSGAGEDPMAALAPDLGEPEGRQQAGQVAEGDVRDVAGENPGEQPIRLHIASEGDALPA